MKNFTFILVSAIFAMYSNGLLALPGDGGAVQDDSTTASTSKKVENIAG